MTDTTDLGPNTALAWQVWDLIEAHEDRLDMFTWAWLVGHPFAPVGLPELTRSECGATACAAGWTLVACGYRVDNSGFVYNADGTLSVEHNPANPVDIPSALANVGTLAARLLRISEADAVLLFLYTDDEELAERWVQVFGPRPDPVDGASVEQRAPDGRLVG